MDLCKKKKQTWDGSSVFLVVKISILYLCRNDRTVKTGHGGKAQQRCLLGCHRSCIEADTCNYSGAQTVEQNPNTERVEHHMHFIQICYWLSSKCMFLYFDKFKEDALFYWTSSSDPPIAWQYRNDYIDISLWQWAMRWKEVVYWIHGDMDKELVWDHSFDAQLSCQNTVIWVSTAR